ncbi:chemotaxis protein CheW [Paenibacillus spongiae]|uniref:Chemotaxis protein CheW n=1 Tax=Paenibacillus spongiae TaxID=2909671 RepID=A0ABY5SBC5_9BACL|nr:chemotaxis protein CheW [Paenibacillus spongiae]UVI31251.1 chemotaxis protein CheW [Paenibacillus spongiae]
MNHSAHEQYVEFGVGEENYAIQISDVHEIIKMQDITDIPNCPYYVEGVINLRGRIVPIISLRSLFAIGEEPFTKTTRIVVVHHKDDSVGIIVDRVNQVAVYADIQTPPERVGGISETYFVGIGIAAAGLVGILKLDEVLIRE